MDVYVCRFRVSGVDTNAFVQLRCFRIRYIENVQGVRCSVDHKESLSRWVVRYDFCGPYWAMAEKAKGLHLKVSGKCLVGKKVAATKGRKPTENGDCNAVDASGHDYLEKRIFIRPSTSPGVYIGQLLFERF